MTALFAYPKSAAFGRVLPKTKIYEHAGAKSALKDLFVQQVDQIIWTHKLAPETVNLNPTKTVTELQIFEIRLKTSKLDEAVLRAIDKAIPFPLIFELTHEGRTKVVAAFKRPSEADNAKWVVSDYFSTGWMDGPTPRAPLPVVLDLAALYDKILTALMPAAAPKTEEQTGEGIKDRVERLEAITAKTREIDRIKTRLAREKQFNKRVAINAELRAANQELAELNEASRTGKASHKAAASE